MKTSGTGGANTNRTGLTFEKNTSLASSLSEVGYIIDNDKVYLEGTHIATLLPQGKLRQWLKHEHNTDMANILSASLRPDEAIYIHSARKIHIVEKKWQEVPGSVDEKIQTCGFKIRQYRKLFMPLNIGFTYSYLFNDWWKHTRYNDVKEYMNEIGVRYFFNHIPLDAIDL